MDVVDKVDVGAKRPQSSGSAECLHMLKKIRPLQSRVMVISTAVIMFAQAASGPMKGLVSWSVVQQ